MRTVRPKAPRPSNTNRRILRNLFAAVLTFAATSALADEGGFCAERPGQTTPPCVLGQGQVVIETAAASWAVSSDSSSRSDTLLIADSLVRFGVLPNLEAQLGWTPVGYIRVRDQATPAATATTQTGDIRLGLLYGLTGPDGPAAIQGFVSLPVGRDPIGSGDWSAGLRLPVSFSLTETLQLAFTPEMDAAVNSSQAGRHLAYGGAAGLGYALTGNIQLGTDIAIFRDRDVSGTTTSAMAGLSLAWQAGQNTQLDLGGVLGLNRNSPDLQISVGIAHRF
jgi:hypothetical protein